VRQVIVARALHETGPIIGACVRIRVAVRAPRARPLPLQRATLMRVISFTRTHPRRSRLQHRQEPDRVRIRIAVRAPVRAPPPAAARGPLRVILFAQTRPRQSRYTSLPKRCARVRVFVCFRRIARARVCTLFRYQSRVRIGMETPEICITLK